MSFHANNGVDAYLASRLPEFGYCVDVGANIESSLSNSLHFEEKGWIVLCIEPNPKLLDLGRQYRKLWLPCACGGESRGEVQFTSVGDYPFASWSGIDNEERRKRSAEISPNGETFSVPLRTLDGILEQSGFPRLDFLTIDTEGYELEVLRGINLERWRPSWISAESWDNNGMIDRHLDRYGYVFDRRMEVDNLYRRT